MMIATAYAIAFSLLTVYIFIMLKYIRLWNSTPDFSFSNSNSDVSISVIIPFYNEEKTIDRLIQSLLRQSLKKESWNVLFVNDNSTDRSIEIISRLCEGRLNFRLLNNNGSGKKRALTTGINSVREGLIVTADADCSFNPDWLKTISSFYHKNSADMIIMPVVMTGGDNFFQQFQKADFLALQMVGAGAALSGNPILCNGANLTFKKQKEQVTMNEKYASGEDIFMLEWMKRKGREIRYLKSKNVVAKTPGPETVRQFINQRARWISKAGGYSDRSVVLMSLLFFGVNVFQLILLIIGFTNHAYLALWLAFFTLKTITDYSLISSGFSFFETKTSTVRFILMQIIYPIYMLFVSFYGIVFPVKWKRNKI